MKFEFAVWVTHEQGQSTALRARMISAREERAAEQAIHLGRRFNRFHRSLLLGFERPAGERRDRLDDGRAGQRGGQREQTAKQQSDLHDCRMWYQPNDVTALAFYSASFETGPTDKTRQADRSADDNGTRGLCRVRVGQPGLWVIGWP